MRNLTIAQVFVLVTIACASAVLLVWCIRQAFLVAKKHIANNETAKHLRFFAVVAGWGLGLFLAFLIETGFWMTTLIVLMVGGLASYSIDHLAEYLAYKYQKEDA